jgi:hypothetical protein
MMLPVWNLALYYKLKSLYEAIYSNRKLCHFDITVDLRLELIKRDDNKIRGSLQSEGGRVQCAKLRDSSTPSRLCVMRFKRRCKYWWWGRAGGDIAHILRQAFRPLARNVGYIRLGSQRTSNLLTQILALNFDPCHQYVFMYIRMSFMPTTVES